MPIALALRFEGYFESPDLRQRLEIINPVQTKVHKCLGNLVARQIVGQPRSTVDFRQLVAGNKWQSIAVGDQAAAWGTEGKISDLGERDAERAPVQSAIEETTIARIHVL